MITYDKLKLVTSSDHIRVSKGFDVITKDNQFIRQKFKVTSPCSIEIVINSQNKELTLEFSSKLLKDNYPFLISSYTVRTCLESINQIGVCVIDVDAVLREAYVVKCDITKDVKGIDLQKLKDYISTHISNYDKWIMRSVKNNNNIIIEKNVVTSRHKRRLAIYDKEEEIARSKNKDFLLWSGQEVVNAFKGITRFELSLTTCSAIRSDLNIDDTKLASVLNAQASPIADLLESALRPDTDYTTNVTKLSQFDKQIVLAYYNWDLSAIEKNARMIYGDRYHKSKLIPYQILIDAHSKNSFLPPPIYNFQTLCTFDTTTYCPTMTPVTADYWKGSRFEFLR